MAKSKLKELVEQYGEMKGIADSYKKPIEQLNANIKAIMRKSESNECESGGYKVKYSVSTSQTFDEDKLLHKLLEQLSEEDYRKVVKTKEYVDMEALEDAIYNGVVSASELADCKVTKSVEKLTVSKVKEK